MGSPFSSKFGGVGSNVFGLVAGGTVGVSGNAAAAWVGLTVTGVTVGSTGVTGVTVSLGAVSSSSPVGIPGTASSSGCSMAGPVLATGAAFLPAKACSASDGSTVTGVTVASGCSTSSPVGIPGRASTRKSSGRTTRWRGAAAGAAGAAGAWAASKSKDGSMRSSGADLASSKLKPVGSTRSPATSLATGG